MCCTHALAELTNVLYLLALVILPLVLIGLHNHRRKMTFIIYLLLADTLSHLYLLSLVCESSLVASAHEHGAIIVGAG